MVSRQLIDYLNLERTRNQSARHQGSGWRADGGDYAGAFGRMALVEQFVDVAARWLVAVLADRQPHRGE